MRVSSTQASEKSRKIVSLAAMSQISPPKPAGKHGLVTFSQWLQVIAPKLLDQVESSMGVCHVPMYRFSVIGLEMAKEGMASPARDY